MQHNIRNIAIVSALLLISSLIWFEEIDAQPFKIPEKLFYDLTWGGIKAGSSSLEIRAENNAYRIISSASSADWVSVFYKVEDRIESIIPKKNGSGSIAPPSSYRVRIKEGRHRRDKEIAFNHDANKALYVDHLGQEKRNYKIPPRVFDPLSGFLEIRTRQLRAGESQWVKIFDSKKTWDVEVQVLRKERLRLPAGTFDTIVIKPLMKSEGIFYRKGEVTIWLTDDAKHVPVKLQTKIPVGHVTATLVRGEY